MLSKFIVLAISSSKCIHAIDDLQKLVQDMQVAVLKKEEQAYISQCVDTAMHEMGYKIIGEREIVKKDGR